MRKHNTWLDFAYMDLKAAKKLLAEDLIGPAIFHTQQCGEKALKAYLEYKNEPIRRIHDLVKLVTLCKQFDKDFEEVADAAVSLNPFLCQTRYPDDCFMMPDITTLKFCIEQAEKILDFVESKIND